MNLEIAHQFAKEKRLELLECDTDDQSHVDSTFLRLIEKVMTSWEGGITGGNDIVNPLPTLITFCLIIREHSAVRQRSCN